MAAKEIKPIVTFFHRKPRPVGNYSVEFIFEDVRNRLNGNIQARTAYSKYESAGLFKRIYNCIEAAFRQSEVNHVTGDINYLGLLLSRKRTIQTILDCVHLNTSSGLKYKVLKLFWLSIPARRSSYLTAISNSTKNEILKHVHCDPSKIRVIYVAISGKFRKKEKAFNKKEPRILQVGAAHNKNIPRLVEALEGIPCVLEIIGKKEQQYEDMMKSRGIKYEYRSGLSDEEMIRRYEEADIISLASTYEGFGMPILEAQAIGRPVITSNLYSMPEVAGEAACLVDPFDVSSIRNAVIRVIEDDAYRSELITRGFDNVKRFDADTIAHQYLELYKEVASRGER
jgi:glycosyltransferase involved in cell wall biosynthesis